MAQPRRVLITGASGFIGANLTRAEIDAGSEVHLLLRAEANPWRLNELAGRFHGHRGDLRTAGDVRRAVEAARPDVVYHLATHGADPSQHYRATILATNLTGTVNLLEALAGRDYLTLVHAGSSSEYGHKEAPMRPGDVLEPRTDYAVAKAAATLLCQAEAYKGAPVCTVRIFSAYGPWEEPTRIASHVMGCCLRGEPVRVTAGHQPRDFIFVDDVVTLLRVAGSRPDLRGRILLAGTGRRQSVRDLVETALGVAGAGPAEYGALAGRPDEPAVWVADIADTVDRTGWRPTHDLRAGITKMWAWFRTEVRHGQRASA